MHIQYQSVTGKGLVTQCAVCLCTGQAGGGQQLLHFCLKWVSISTLFQLRCTHSRRTSTSVCSLLVTFDFDGMLQTEPSLQALVVLRDMGATMWRQKIWLLQPWWILTWFAREGWLLQKGNGEDCAMRGRVQTLQEGPEVIGWMVIGSWRWWWWWWWWWCLQDYGCGDTWWWWSYEVVVQL